MNFEKGNTNAEKTDDDAAEKVEEGESEINGENKEDDMERRKGTATTSCHYFVK